MSNVLLGLHPANLKEDILIDRSYLCGTPVFLGRIILSVCDNQLVQLERVICAYLKKEAFKLCHDVNDNDKVMDK